MSIGPPLRDIQLPPEPGWWPPTIVAVVTLVVFLAALVLVLALLWRQLARRRRARALARFFDAQLACADSEEERLQRASTCLRRVVARRHPGAVAMTGASWLAVLDDDDPEKPFSAGPGRLLADGPYRSGVHPGTARVAIDLARVRFLQWGREADA